MTAYVLLTVAVVWAAASIACGVLVGRMITMGHAGDFALAHRHHAHRPKRRGNAAA
jgi:hypothetical protein